MKICQNCCCVLWCLPRYDGCACCLKLWFLVGVCQGSQANLGRREANECWDIRHPSKVQPRARWLPWQRIHRAPRRPWATSEQRLLRATQGCSPWFQRRIPRWQRRPGFFWFWVQGKYVNSWALKNISLLTCSGKSVGVEVTVLTCCCYFFQKDNKVAA